jgi:hypothetical protein
MWGQQSKQQKGNQAHSKKQEEWFDDELVDE